jgi:hypothetical protein
MYMGIINSCNVNAQHIYIYSDLQNKVYAPELALGRCKVSGVSHGRLLELLRHKDLLLILLDDLLVLLIVSSPELHQEVLYMYAIKDATFSITATTTLRNAIRTLSYPTSITAY